jgi:hypothetical protein
VLLEALQEGVIDMGDHVHQGILDSVEGIHQVLPLCGRIDTRVSRG